MRQQLIDNPSTSSTRSARRRRGKGRASLQASTGCVSSRQVFQPTTRHQPKFTLTPVRKVVISLVMLAPMAALGTLCYALVENNLKLHQKNDELTGIANEVRTEIDLLSEEIETLQQRAGVVEGTATPKAGAAKVSSADSGKSEGNPASVSGGFETGRFETGGFKQSPSPRGGLAREADALDLLEDAKAQVPKLNKAKPLEATLAAEAAYPSGLPMTGSLDISSEFGLRNNPFGGGGFEVHEGMDFIGNVGDIIAATGDGVVTLAGPNGGYGNTVTIDHGYGYETLYAHMSKVSVKVGDRIKRGQIVGHVGSTGRSSGPHLHYSLYKDKKAINPRQVMNIPKNVLAAGSR